MDVRLAIVGFGRMGQLYARALMQQGGRARLVAVVDPVLHDDGRALLDALGVACVTETLQDALSREAVDAVVVATPTHRHADDVCAAAGAGKAVFCEKPLALSLSDTHRALDAVARSGVALQVGFMRRFDAAYRQARAWIEEGRIGRPVTFKAVGRDPFCPPPAFADPRSSGGLILDMGIHDFDLARWLMQADVAAVSAYGTLQVCAGLEAVGDIDNAVVNLAFENGAIGNVEVSRTAFYGYDIRTEVLGSEGALRIGYDRQTPVLLLTRDGAHHDVVPYLLDRFGSAYRAQLAAFVQAIVDGVPPAVGGREALAAFEVGLAATYAVRAGRSVSPADVRAGWTPDRALP